MNKDIFWNVTIGVLSAILIGGGAYVMATGGAKNQAEQQQAVAIETVATDSAVTEQAQPQKVEVKKDEPKTDLIKKDNKKNKTMEIEGMKIEITKEGTGEGVKTGQYAVVHYTGKFTDGKVFDSSVGRGQPFPVQLGANTVIQGWEKGLLGMKKGEERTLTIPPELAYGANGIGGVIPPNATLVFDVALVDIK